MVRIAAIAAALALAACFSPSHDRCAVSCAADRSCPPGFSCLSDDFCHAAPTEALCSIDGDAGIDGPIGPGCGDGIRQTDLAEECDDNNTNDGDGCSANCREESGFVCVGDAGELSTCRPNPSKAGDLVITEIMANPTGDENFREWFEIANPTDTDFDLRDLRVSDPNAASETFTVNESLVLPAGGQVVLGKSAELDKNGGAPVDYAYGTVFLLSNDASGDEIVLSSGGVEIDRVDYPDPTQGAAFSLDPDLYDSVSNDMSSSFCLAVDPFGDGDLGTPGMVNPDCP